MTPETEALVTDLRPGDIFGRLIVIGVGMKKRGRQHVLVRCTCPKAREWLVTPYSLHSGHTRSCGCLRKEQRASRRHGGRYTPEYRAWQGAIQRCENTASKHWPNWGGRGIRIASAWRASFARFLADMGPRPSPQHSLDRRDNDGPYSAENCRWATRVEQRRNVRSNRLVTIGNETKPLSAWAEQSGIEASALRMRILRGVSQDRLLAPTEQVYRLQRQLMEGQRDGQA